MTTTLDYALYVDNAMRTVVRDLLRQVQKTGLPGQHHFFVSFRTDIAGVGMSDGLRSKYPHEITIVLQHQFWDLNVEDDHFKVALSFNNIPEKLTVPFSALTAFADPSTKFGLQFHQETAAPAPEAEVPVAVPLMAAVGDEDKATAQIFALDAFRKK